MLGIGLVEEWEEYLHHKHNEHVPDARIAAVKVMLERLPVFHI